MVASLAERLGFAQGARVAIVHADDIGMCHAANTGAFEALDAGPVTCGSAMVPCPWFAEAVACAARRPGVDIGVHLTLNAEWDLYRWPPCAGPSQVPSLVDDDGCLYRTTAQVVANARPEEVELELRTQIERARGAGLDVTHLDAHMGTVLMPPFTQVYASLIRAYRLPAFLVAPRADAVPEAMRSAVEQVVAVVRELEEDGFPVLDGFDQDSLGFARGQGLAHNRRRLAGLGPGVNYLICHPAALEPELEVLTPDAHCRDFERSFYGGQAGRAELAALGIETVGMRALAALIPD